MQQELQVTACPEAGHLLTDPASGRAGASCVLVVDDESTVRLVVARMLESAGYRVLGAGDGVQALELLERGGIGIDLVLTDIRMPRLGGIELGRRTKAVPTSPLRHGCQSHSPPRRSSTWWTG